MVADAAPSLPFYYYHLPAMTGVERKSLHVYSSHIPLAKWLLKFTHVHLYYNYIIQCQNIQYKEMYFYNKILPVLIIFFTDLVLFNSQMAFQI